MSHIRYFYSHISYISSQFIYFHTFYILTIASFRKYYNFELALRYTTSDIEAEVIYPEPSLLIIYYPGDTKQISITRNNEEEYISYPGENFKLVKIEPYNDKITMYYVIFNGIKSDYHSLYYPEKEAKIKEVTNILIKKLRS